MTPAILLRLYPRAWRERYGAEFVALLQQTGVGWRQITDVIAAASREWVKTMVRWPSLQPFANKVRRGLGYFSIAWCVTALGSLVFGDTLTESFWNDALQLQMVALFLTSAVMCNVFERNVFRFVLRGRATSGEALGVQVLGYVVVVIAVLAVTKTWLHVHFALLDTTRDVVPFVMCGEFFGRATGPGQQMPPNMRHIGVA